MPRSVFRRAYRAGFDGGFALGHDAIGNLFHHLLEQHAQMCVRSIIRRRDVFHAIGVGRELVTLSEPQSRSCFAAWTCQRVDEFEFFNREIKSAKSGA